MSRAERKPQKEESPDGPHTDVVGTGIHEQSLQTIISLKGIVLCMRDTHVV